MTEQPSWWCIANLGDVDPYEHGGAFLLVDRRGTYVPELILVESVDDTDNRRVSNIALDPVTVIKYAGRQSGSFESQWAGLSDNPYHPDKMAWFGELDDLRQVANFITCDLHAFMHDLLSRNPIKLAYAYKAMAEYHGIDNFDAYPQTLTKEKAQLLCDRFLKQIQESESWHDGYFDD